MNKDNKRARRIFNSIAGIYNLFHKSLVEDYIALINRLKIDFSDKTILDAGTGTGAPACAFKRNGAKSVTGIDISEKMVRRASENCPKIEFRIDKTGDFVEINPKSFDIVSAFLMLHGSKREQRLKLIQKFAEITSEYLIIFDFYGKTPFYEKILEFMERSDYVNFKNTIESDLKTIFTEVNILPVERGKAFYICKI